MPERVLLFLYGRRNLVGSVLALLGLALFFAGLVKKFWLFIVLGLYALGYLLTPPKRSGFASAAGLNTDSIEDALERLSRSMRRKVPADVRDRVEAIRTSILAILPDLRELQGIEHRYNVHVVRETALVYLPDLLGRYIKLPAAFARLHKLRDGRTAHQLVLEQLDLLDGEMKQIAVDLHRGDLEALAAHGRFLQEKFGAGDWDLD